MVNFRGRRAFGIGFPFVERGALSGRDGEEIDDALRDVARGSGRDYAYGDDLPEDGRGEYHVPEYRESENSSYGAGWAEESPAVVEFWNCASK